MVLELQEHVLELEQRVHERIWPLAQIRLSALLQINDGILAKVGAIAVVEDDDIVGLDGIEQSHDIRIELLALAVGKEGDRAEPYHCHAVHTGNHRLHIALGEDDRLDMFPLAERFVQGRREERVCTFLGLSAGELVFGLPWVGCQILRIHTSDEVGIFHYEIRVLGLLVAFVANKLTVQGVGEHANIVLVVGLEQWEWQRNLLAFSIQFGLGALLAFLVVPKYFLNASWVFAYV